MSVELEETFREAAPLHFRFKIESFSMLEEKFVSRFKSNEFETGGYKWKLSFYPDGNKDENGNDHISLYLVLVDSSSGSTSLPDSWELNVFFRLFLFDQIRGRYFIRGDTEGKTRRFHDMKKVWGFPQFVSLAKLKDPANGYLVDDTCVFGAEVFIAKPTGNIDCLTMVKQPTTVNYTWKIENFSNLKEESLESEKFKAGGYNWNVEIYPKGYSEGENNSVTLYLFSVDCKENTALKVFTNFKVSLRDQINGNHEICSADHWFCTSKDNMGWPKFIGLDRMNGQGNGYLVNDTCILEVEVEVLGVVISERLNSCIIEPSRSSLDGHGVLLSPRRALAIIVVIIIVYGLFITWL